MPESRFVADAALFACWSLVACGSSPGSREQGTSNVSAGNGAADATSESEGAPTGEDAMGAALDAGVDAMAGDPTANDAVADDAIADDAVADDAVADAARTYDGSPQCDVEGGCASNCTDAAVACAVVPDNVACELSGGFVGASASLTCGQSAVVGTACCGGCGCVAVDVYFDGTWCWEGIPDCMLAQFNGKYIVPHAPGGRPAGEGGPASGVSAGEGGPASEGGSAGEGGPDEGGLSEGGPGEGDLSEGVSAGAAGPPREGGP